MVTYHNMCFMCICVHAVAVCRHSVFENGSLKITQLDLPDAGKYQCFACNSVGEEYLAVTLLVNSEC